MRQFGITGAPSSEGMPCYREDLRLVTIRNGGTEYTMLKLKTHGSAQSPWCSSSREDLQAAVQCLRNNFISYVGPFVIKSGIAVFKVSDYVLTVDELVSLCKSGQLTEEGLSRFAKELDAVEQRLTSQGRR